MRYAFIVLVFFSVTSYGQSFYPVPVEIFDSLVFETSRGRACNQLQQAQAAEIKALGYEIATTGEGLRLSISYGEVKDLEVKELRLALSKQEQKTIAEVKRAKKKGFRKGIISGVLVGLVALIL